MQRHPDYESRNTSVSDYFLRFSTGKQDQMPLDPRSEVTDERPDEEKIEDDSLINSLGCDDLDVIMEMEENSKKFQEALADIELTKTQRKQFDDATNVLNNPNSSAEQKYEAYELLKELSDKVTRARAKS